MGTNSIEKIFSDDIPEKLDLHVKEGESLCLRLATTKDFKGSEINVTVEDFGSFDGAFAEFSGSSFLFKLNVFLKGNGSECNWHLATITKGKSTKTFETSVIHEKLSSVALMENYGIAEDESKLVFSGVSHIHNGAKKTKTKQSAKIIVFDPLAEGRASPILKIDENDVEASHAAIVGRLNDDHMFYLRSRGISEDESKRLITMGYLKPIEAYFNNDELKNKIDEAIEGGF